MSSLRRYRRQEITLVGPRRTKSLIIVLSASILLVCNQWRLTVHYLHDLKRNNFSFSSTLPSPQLSAEDHVFHEITSHSINESYITSPLCGACYSGHEFRTTCVDFINKELQHLGYNSSVLDAAINVAKVKPKLCALCDPEKCQQHHFHSEHDNDKSFDDHYYKSKFWRFDRSNPTFINPTTLTLNSIPSYLRMPSSRFKDIGLFYEEMYNSSIQYNKSMLEFLVEYNPGLVAIPLKMKKHLPVEAAYLMSLRVTPANNCFPPQVYENLPKAVWKAVYQSSVNHIGLALLDKKFSIIGGYEVVIELDTQLGLKRKMPPMSALSPTFLDYRLFQMNNDIYLHVNADTVLVTKLILRAKGFENADVTSEKENRSDLSISYQDSLYDNEEDRRYHKFKLHNLYGGDSLVVSIEHQFNTIWSGGIHGKNYALFSLPNSTNPDSPESVYVEIDISPIHRVQQILPDEYDLISLKQVFEHIWKPNTSKRRNFNIDKVLRRSMKTVGNNSESEDATISSFFTMDALWYPGHNSPFKKKSHGGACCVMFSVDDVNVKKTKSNHLSSLLVGIAHTKVPWTQWYSKASTTQAQKDFLPHTHYVSFFYAFDPHPPFQLRARSGYFCLGFSSLLKAEGGSLNPHTVLTRNRKLRQNNVTFDCPQMHFVSSFIEKVGDSSSTVIGYGINDCTSRLVEVKKVEVIRLLFPDPMDMVFERF